MTKPRETAIMLTARVGSRRDAQAWSGGLGMPVYTRFTTPKGCHGDHHRPPEEASSE